MLEKGDGTLRAKSVPNNAILSCSLNCYCTFCFDNKTEDPFYSATQFGSRLHGFQINFDSLQQKARLVLLTNNGYLETACKILKIHYGTKINGEKKFILFSFFVM